MRIDPNDARALPVLGEVLLFSGHYNEAIVQLERAMQLDPGFPERYRVLIGQARFHKGEFEATLDAMEAFCENASVRHSRLVVCNFYRASALAQIGRASEAKELVKSYSQLYNLASLQTTRTLKLPFKGPEASERIMVGLQNIWRE